MKKKKNSTEKKDTTTLSKIQKVVLRKKKISSGYSLYLDIHKNGKRIKEYLQLYISDSNKPTESDKETLRLAEKIQTIRALELQADFHNEPDFSPKKKSFKSFLADNINNSTHLKTNTIKKKIALQRIINVYHPEQLLFRDINQGWLENFRNYLLSRYKRNTADRYFSELKTNLTIAVKQGIIKSNPMFMVENIGRDKSLPKYLTQEEMKMLKATKLKNSTLKRAFFFACYSGLRLGDIKSLKWENIFESNGDFFIRITQEKSKSEIINPLSPEAVKYLVERGNNNDYVFQLPKEAVIDKSLKRWAKRAGLSKNLNFHMSRHTFGTLCISSDIDLYITSALMGHSDTRVTQVYAKITDKRKKDAVMKLPSIE
ncbi:MAG: site-specific integrase [Candidatus Kapabacteria bacterium]|nr:site-specific integrase [Candidatus Kapabacteria bacterium]